MNTALVQEQLQKHLSFLEQDKTNLNLLIEISNLYVDLGNMPAAQQFMNKASAIDRERCLGYQGLLYLNQGQIDKAQQYFQEALMLEDNPELRYNLGISCYVNHDYQQAREVLSPIIENEELPLAKLLMARILHQQNAIEEAINLLEQLVQKNAHDAEALGFLSLLYFDSNKEDLAQELSQRALALNPEMYDAQLVDLMLRLLTQETTVDEIQSLIQVNPQDTRLWFALGNTYMSQGDFKAAIKSLQEALKIHPEFYDCYIVLAWCQLLNNQIDKAQATYQNAISLVDSLADGFGGLALVHALNADLPTAKELINKANSLNPECFLTQIANVIYLGHQNQQQAGEHLFNVLTNKKLPVSEQLALIIEEFAH